MTPQFTSLAGPAAGLALMAASQRQRAGIAWFHRPLLFILTTTSLLLIVIRRAYLSRSLTIIDGESD